MISDDTLSLLVCQIAIPATQSAAARDEHLAESSRKVRAQLGAHPADLVVLPELSSIDSTTRARPLTG